ncbi:fibronectin type III domain-containing protein [Sunxiuqinia elliptica]|uniref:fibronectin type III domain-containing protein n=1 Tax=Sunxiuqinia elliptica TaxID=655355 RepID=UPI000B822383|nr:fibronectin type III domain-containing protein [Sunxiuqinia elliptica]
MKKQRWFLLCPFLEGTKKFCNDLSGIKKKCLFLIVSFFVLNLSSYGQTIVNVNIDYSNVELVSSYHAGVTHTQKSIDWWGDANAIASAKQLLSSVTYFQNQHIMGWGPGNPWPDSTVVDPANWNWSVLDDRINLIRDTNGEAVITLCACPTWMHTPSMNGQTDWSKIEEAPTPDHYDDFAHLCAEVARRYPDVKYFQIWNELKGFFDGSLNRWGYETFTDMYNMVYDSLKAVNPNLLIGGPYVPMDTWSTANISHPSNLSGVYGVFDQRALDVISYWLQNKNGGDFITVDGGNDNKDGVWNTDAFKASQKFVDLINWVRQQPGGSTLPVWWSEWYGWPGAGSVSSYTHEYNNAVMASGLIKSIKAGYQNLMIWGPQGDSQGYSYPLGVWTDTEISGGGQATLFYYTQKGLKDNFSNGTQIYSTTISVQDVVSVMATNNKVILVNQLDQQVQVTIQNTGTTLTLDNYEVRFIDVTGVDTQVPTAPTGLTSSNITGSSFSLSWNASTDNVGVTDYGIYIDGVWHSAVSGTSTTISGLAANTQYTVSVLAYDAAGNYSAQSSPITVTTTAGVDTQVPTLPTGLAASNITENSFSLSWNASTDNVGVTDYGIYIDGVWHSAVSGTSTTISGLAANTQYTVSVLAYDAAGNYSAQSSPISVTTTSGVDTQVPTPPTGLAASNITASGFSLSWNASTDNVGVTDYGIYIDGVWHSAVSGTSTTISGLTANTQYTMSVLAYDAAGNYSAQSSSISVTTVSPSLAEGTYRLKCKASSLYLNGNNVEWVSVKLAPLEETWWSQRWDLEKVSGNVYRLKCKWDGLYLNGTQTANTDVQMAALHPDWGSQKWTLEHVSGSEYRLKCNWGTNYLHGTSTSWGTATNKAYDGSNYQVWNLEFVGSTKSAKIDVEGVDEVSELLVYPNPVKTGVVTIKNLREDVLRIAIVNMSGSILRTQEVNGEKELTLDIRGVAPGMYVVVVEGKEKVEKAKLSVQ